MTTQNARTDGNGNKTTLILDENDNVVRLTTEMLTPETSGDTIAPATNSADYIPQWDGADSKTLKNGLAVPDGGLAGLTALGGKVDKETGKGLSTNDYTTDEKNKLSGIAERAEVNVNADWNASTGDAQILNKPTIPDELSDLSDDSTHRLVTDTEKSTWNDKVTHTPQVVTITDATPDTGTITTRPTGYHYDTFTAAIAADTTLTSTMSDGDAYEVLLSFSGSATVTFTGVTLPNSATVFTVSGVSGDKKSVVVKRIGSVYTGRTD